MGRAERAGWTGTAADLEVVLERAADAITVQAPDGSLVYANRAAVRALGYRTREELLATPVSDLLAHFELLDEGGAPLPPSSLPSRRALAGESGPPTSVRFRTVATGEEHWSLVQATPVVEHGRVRMVINTFQDITDLKRTEQRLRLLADVGTVLDESVDYHETLQRLARMLVPALADWCVVDIVESEGGYRRLAVAHTDPAKEALAEEIQRRYPSDPSQPGGAGEVIRTGEPQVIPEVTDEMLRAAARDEEHLDLLRQAGIASAVIAPLSARGQVLGAMTLVGSPGGHRYGEADLPLLLELARRAALSVDNARLLDEANRSVQMRDDFLAMASHDMRTPLAVIMANIQLARRRLAQPDVDTADVVRHLESAERTTQKMTGLVGELMDVTILRSGQHLPLSRDPIDLGALAASFAEEYQGLTDQHTFAVDVAEPVVGEWDAQRVERVLRNIVDNALKYSPHGGSIRIAVRSEPRSDGGRWAVVAVTDEGVGIPDDELTGLFEKFQRGSNTRDLRGTGLGLTGSRAVVEQLGGSVDVDSTLGRGSTFTIRLPIADGS